MDGEGEGFVWDGVDGIDEREVFADPADLTIYGG